jgi:hypothetical protein
MNYFIIIIAFVLFFPLYLKSQETSFDKDFEELVITKKSAYKKTLPKDEEETLTYDRKFFNRNALRKIVDEHLQKQLKVREDAFLPQNTYLPAFPIYSESYDEENTHLKSAITEDSLNRFMFDAARKGDYNGVLALLDKGVKPDVRNKFGNTPLMSSIASNNNNIATLLILRGANINLINSKQQSAIHLATSNNNFGMVDTLISRYAYVNAPDIDGNTPMLLAAIRKHWDMVKYLVDYGANIHTRNKNGLTVLHLAACCGNYDIVNILLQKNANPFATTIQGATPKDLALGVLDERVVAILDMAEKNQLDESFKKKKEIIGRGFLQDGDLSPIYPKKSGIALPKRSDSY